MIWVPMPPKMRAKSQGIPGKSGHVLRSDSSEDDLMVIQCYTCKMADLQQKEEINLYGSTGKIGNHMPSQCVFKMASHLVVSTFTIFDYLGTKSVAHLFVFKSQTHTQLPTVEENTCNIYTDHVILFVQASQRPGPTAHQLLRLHHLPPRNKG